MVSIRCILIGIVSVVLAGVVYYVFFMPEPLPEEATFEDEFSLVLKDYDGNDVALS